MTRRHLGEGQVLFREGDPSECVFRVLSGAVDVFREIDGEPILLGSVDAGQFIGEMGVVENRSRSATVRAASEVARSKSLRRPSSSIRSHARLRPLVS